MDTMYAFGCGSHESPGASDSASVVSQDGSPPPTGAMPLIRLRTGRSRRVRSRGLPTPSLGSGGSFPGADAMWVRSSGRAAALPSCMATNSSTPTPLPSIVTNSAPADVPMMAVASRGSQSSASRTEASAATVQAKPRVPPQPMAKPRLGALFWRTVVPVTSEVMFRRLSVSE